MSDLKFHLLIQDSSEISIPEKIGIFEDKIDLYLKKNDHIPSELLDVITSFNTDFVYKIDQVLEKVKGYNSYSAIILDGRQASKEDINDVKQRMYDGHKITNAFYVLGGSLDIENIKRLELGSIDFTSLAEQLVKNVLEKSNSRLGEIYSNMLTFELYDRKRNRYQNSGVDMPKQEKKTYKDLLNKDFRRVRYKYEYLKMYYDIIQMYRDHNNPDNAFYNILESENKTTNPQLDLKKFDLTQMNTDIRKKLDGFGYDLSYLDDEYSK